MQKTTIRLRMRRETLRRLTTDQTARINGGAPTVNSLSNLTFYCSAGVCGQHSVHCGHKEEEYEIPADPTYMTSSSNG